MSFSNRRDDGDIGRRDLAKLRDFPFVFHAHFQNGHLDVFVKIEHRQRQTDFVVAVSLRFLRLFFLRKHAIQHVFAACFSIRAGHADHKRMQRVQIRFRQRGERLLRVFNQNQRQLIRVWRMVLLPKRQRGAVLRHLLDK